VRRAGYTLKIVDLKRKLLLNPFSLLIEPLVIYFDCLGLFVVIDGDLRPANAVKRSTDSTGNPIPQLVVRNVKKLRRQSYLPSCKPR
jgi:hypothetical protein